MASRDASGSSVRDKLEMIQRNTGRTPPELQNLIELPESCYDVWSWFIELHNTRTSTGFGANPITYSDMHSFFALNCIQPEQWEIKLIRAMDNIVLEQIAKESARAAKTNKPPKK